MPVKTISFNEVWRSATIMFERPDRRLVTEQGDVLNVWFDLVNNTILVDSVEPLHHAIIKQEYANPIDYDVVGFVKRGRIIEPPSFK